MPSSFQYLAENILIFRDTCNVFVIIQGSDAVLIDFGSGAILPRLKEIGVERVEAILHTHHHRDQAQGDVKAVGTFQRCIA